MNDQSIIHVFPLESVLFPHVPLPLHIFEERYKKMIRRCLGEDLSFGVIFADEDGIRETGCTAKISKITKEYQDGRMDILTIGTHRFVTQSLIDEDDYLQAEIVYFDEFEGQQEQRVRDLKIKGIDLFQEAYATTPGQIPVQDIDRVPAKFISFFIASYAEISMFERQSLLELRSTKERLVREIAALERILEESKELRTRVRRMQSNGYFKGLP